MPTKRPRKAVRPDDGRLKANKKRTTPEPPKSRYQQLIDGTLKVEDLEDEEIKKGRCMDKNGGFSGRPPSNFPRALHDAMHNEFIKRTQESFKPMVSTATDVLLEIAQNKRAAGPARVRAAEILIERGAGKVPDKVFAEVVTKKFEENIEGLFVDMPVEDEVGKKRKEKGA